MEAGFDDAWHAEWWRQMEESGGNIIAGFRMRIVEITDKRVVMSMPFGPNLRQGTGVFAAGALIQLADVAATIVCSNYLRETSGETDVPFPLSVQISSNLLRNTDRGTVTTETMLLHGGRSMMVAESTVKDDAGRILAIVTSTHLAIQR